MSNKTRVWPVKSTIRLDIVCWPAIILSPVMLLNSGENSFHQKPQIHKIIWKVVQVVRRTSFSVACSGQFYIVLCSLKKKEKHLGMVVWTVFSPTNSVFQPEISAWGPKWPYNPFFGARYFKKDPMYQYLANMQKRRNSWKVKEMKMAVYLKLTWSIPLYTQ